MGGDPDKRWRHERSPSEELDAGAPVVAVREAELTRFVLVIPGDLGLDGYEHADHVGSVEIANRQDDDPPVMFRFFTKESEHGPVAAVMDLLDEHLTLSADLPWEDIFVSPRPSSHYTLVEAVTTSDSPDDHGGKPLLARTPREDPLVRCMRLLSDIVRTTIMASSRLQQHPSIERSLPIHVRYTAPGLVKSYRAEDGELFHSYEPVGEWEGPHMNALDVADTTSLVPSDPVDMEAFRHWMSTLRSGHPAITWREHWFEAQRAMTLNGDYAQAVVLANTSCEAFLDSTLASLYWENGDSAESVSDYFAEGKLLARVTSRFSGLLRGSGWQTEDPGPVRDWFLNTYALRHKVIHGGYRPTYEEARSALDSSTSLRTFVESRLITERARFPKNLIFWLGVEEIRRRGWMRGKVRAASEEMDASRWGVADTLEDSLAYRQRIVTRTKP